MDEYKQPYLTLFNALSRIAEEIERQNYGTAKQLIIAAQRQAEEIFVSADENE